MHGSRGGTKSHAREGEGLVNGRVEEGGSQVEPDVRQEKGRLEWFVTLMYIFGLVSPDHIKSGGDVDNYGSIGY